jgi:uncharacterized protein (DUF433 family)
LTCAYLFLILTAVVRPRPQFTGRTAPLRPHFARLRPRRWDPLRGPPWHRGPVGFCAGSVIFDRVTIEPDKMAGQPCIRGLRIPVATVVAMVADGMSTAEILADLPGLEAEDVAHALRYAAAAVRERGLPLRYPA